MSDSNDDIHRVAKLLNQAHRLLFITGAGMSADSGLPTYRGVGGLYDRGLTPEGLTIEHALSGEIFATRPAVSWKYIAQLEAVCRRAQHNRGHTLIADLGRTKDVCVLTQNVDGFHEAAGSTNVIAMHGDLHNLICTRCLHRWRVTDYEDLSLPPECDECGALVRPDVVLFGEMLPQDRVDHLYDELARGFDLVLSVGTTSVFPYIAGPVVEAAHRGVPTVEINPGRTEVSHLVDTKFSAGAADTLSRLVTAMNGHE